MKVETSKEGTDEDDVDSAGRVLVEVVENGIR